MRVVHDRCCGLDVHKKTVVACVLTSKTKETRTFGTMTRDLLGLAEWLQAEKVSHVVMESTGVYWHPVMNILEGRSFELLVVNARHVKAVPGRKTDVKDAEWLADLLRHGLLRSSFVPDRGQRELREMVRYRRTLIQNRAQLVNRIQKVLEGANIKLGDVASDVMGASGRSMLKELAKGKKDAVAMAELAQSNLRTKKEQLAEALTGSVGSHQRYMLKSLMRLVEQLENEIAELDEEVEKRTRPFRAAITLLDEIPGIGQHTAEEILAETGVDMTRFPTPEAFASWARLCPANNESAGRRRNTSTGQGNKWLRTALVEAVLGAARASRAKPNFFAARYSRLAGRLGARKAAIAVAHSLLVAIYHMLRNGSHYEDLGPRHWEEHHREALAKRTVSRLEKLGYRVAIEGVA